MIKACSAYTDELDDTLAAVSSIKSQIGQLKKNTVGIISCYADFVDTGAYKAICDALPFETIGTTTIANMENGSSENILLTLLVLTSDDVSFSVGLTAGLPGEDEAPLASAYKTAAAKLPAKPAMMLSFAPLLMNVSGDFYANAFDKISGGVPNFGTLAVDHYEDYSHAQVLAGGEAYSDRYAFILISGDISPKFFIAGISPEKFFQEKGLVTSSKGNQLQSVNNAPVIDYMLSLGLNKGADGSIVGVNSFPFIVDMKDGAAPVVRATFAITPDGSAVCGGNIPVGSVISVATIESDDILSTTEKTVKEVVSSGKHSLIIMFSCVGRYFSLGFDPTIEMEKIRGILGGSDVPYFFAYSGGEICPVYNQKDGKTTANKNHNDTLVICAI